MGTNLDLRVRAAMRTLGARSKAPGCPACGRPISDDDGYPLRGARYHRGCALYLPRQGRGGR